MCQNVNTLKKHYEPWQDRPIEVLARTAPAYDFFQSVKFLEEQGLILHTSLNEDATKAQLDLNFHRFTDKDSERVPDLK